MWWLYFIIFYNIGILPVNIEQLLDYLPNTTRIGIGIVIAGNLIISTFSIIIFGYFGERLSEKFSRKRLFIFTNTIWILSYGLVAISFNYYFYLLFYLMAAIGHGAFIPIGYSMISEYFSPQERGDKYGFMEFGLTIGNGMGIIFGGLLGDYGGIFGWRIAYGLGSLIGFLFLLRYIMFGVEPERGRAEPAFNGFQGQIEYNYRITRKDLVSVFNKKTVSALVIGMVFTGVAMSTLSNWGIYFLTLRFDIVNASFFATMLYILAGIGAIPGTLMGGKIGDKNAKSGNKTFRINISLFGLIIGIFCLMAFYLLPINFSNILGVILSYLILLVFGLFGFFLTTLRLGNLHSIYSDVCLPETRSTAIALNSVMFNIGGVIGNLFLSSLIEINLDLLPSAIFIVLSIWLAGSLLWVVLYKFYPKESNECNAILTKRRIEIENNQI